jgi:8-oxo-dGTP diphosphatase
MKILGYYHDDRFPASPIEMIRFTARVYVVDDQNRIAFLHIQGEDGFGLRNHLESPGGGVETDESFEEAAIREIDEELGASAHDYKELGVVIDRYNIINRMTFSVYFSAKLTSLHNNHHRTEEEKILISSIQWLTPEEALARLKSADSEVDAIVHRRELAAFSALLVDLENRG